MKRCLAIIIVFLLLGAVVNVAVAWTINHRAGPIVYSAARNPQMGEYSWSEAGERWRVTYLAETGMAHLSAWLLPEDYSSFVSRFGNTEITTEHLPRWSGFRGGRSDADGEVLPAWREYARGWPMLSLYMRMEEDTTTFKHVTHRAIDSPFRTADSTRWQRRPEDVLPIGIIRLGFAVNTFFYAVLLGAICALIFAPFALRRRWRINRNLCTSCGYPIGTGPVCTECGAAVARKAKA